MRNYYRLILRKTNSTRPSRFEIEVTSLSISNVLCCFRAELMEIEKLEREELWNLLIQLSDLMNAVNYLPKGFLWSQTFPRWKVGAFGFIASFAGLLKLYRG